MSKREPNLFELLKNKEIIAILDGDTKYDEYEFEEETSFTFTDDGEDE